MDETNERIQVEFYKVRLLLAIIQRNISIEKALATKNDEDVRILSIAQNIDIIELRGYLRIWHEKVKL